MGNERLELSTRVPDPVEHVHTVRPEVPLMQIHSQEQCDGGGETKGDDRSHQFEMGDTYRCQWGDLDF